MFSSFMYISNNNLYVQALALNTYILITNLFNYLIDFEFSHKLM